MQSKTPVSHSPSVTRRLHAVLRDLATVKGADTQRKSAQIIRSHAAKAGVAISKDQLVSVYRALPHHERTALGEHILDRITLKPTRTLSGVAPITVLTKPFPCPGKCIFCPNDIRMPKSYLSDEPGAQRAERNYFDPYLQTYNRLLALHTIGHEIDKAELIVLGGTWSYYPEQYQIWFIKECFRALNDFGKQDDRDQIEQRYLEMESAYKKNKKFFLSNDPEKNKRNAKFFEVDGRLSEKTYNHTVSELYLAPEKLGGFDRYQAADWDELILEQKKNELSEVRSVGLVIETRPDAISPEEVMRIRRLGCTKTQIGLQSLQDSVLKKNKRGHTVAASERAIALLRQAGFKIHAHWMANLYGSSPEQDIEDYDQLFSDPSFRPDELKIYPCSLIGSAELMRYYRDGRWKPFTHDELLMVLEHALTHTPPYCRLTRIIRDIPSQDIVEGNKKTNFRQIAELSLKKKGTSSVDIRAREVRDKRVHIDQTHIEQVVYETSVGTEVFIQSVTKDDQLAAFLRLSLPRKASFIPELGRSAVIRELHVYGKVVGIGARSSGKSQHQGFGKTLIAEAEKVSKQHGYAALAVISAVGTREYYRKQGFADGELYQSKVLR